MPFKKVPIFTGTSGLNNLVDPARVEYDPRTGVGDLVRAVNVKIGPSGDIRLREGFVLRLSQTLSHSLWSDGVNCFFVSGDSLYRLNRDYSKTGIRSGLTVGKRMSFVSVAGVIYYTNGMECGFIVENTSYPWVAGTYTGYANIHKFSNPPVGSLLEVFSSRMYIADGSTLWFSEPFAYSWFDMSKNFIMFPDNIRFIKGVEDALYVGSDSGVDILFGMSPKQFMFKKVSFEAPVEGTDYKFDGSQLAKGVPGTCVSWVGKDGVWVGMSGGNAANLTTKKLVLPEARFGSCVVKDKYMYILLNE